MPDVARRLMLRLARIRYFLPAFALCAVAAFIPHPAVLVVLIAAQPLFLAGAVCFLGYLLEADFLTLALRRGLVFLCLLVPYAALVALIVGTPLMRLTQEATALNALLLSGGFALAIAVLWRLWPAFGLSFLWDDAYPESDGGSWILAAAGRCLAFARHLGAERDAYFGGGLSVAIALLLSVCAAMSIAGLCGLLPSELRIAALWMYALLYCPLAYLWIARRSERLLLEERNDLEAVVEDPQAAPLDGLHQPPLSTPASGPATRDGALLAAAAANQIDLALALIERGADVDREPAASERDQRNLAIIAATCPDLRLLRGAIGKGVNLNRALGGLTPLIAATRDSYQGRPDTVLTLIANGADPRLVDGQGNSALHYAALSCEATVAAILIDAGADPNGINRDGLTPLGMAAAAGNETLIRFLLDHGARPDVVTAQPALIAAAGASEDLPTVAKMLLRHRANPNARDKIGRSALHAAALHGHADYADVLIAAGADIEALDAHGVTPLMEAARGGANRVLKRLVFRKPQHDPVDLSGRSALLIACQSRQADEDTVRSLLALGADPRQTGKDGRSPIDCAVNGGRWNLVALLDPDLALPDALMTHGVVGAEGSAPDRLALIASALRRKKSDVAEELLALTPPLSVAALVELVLALGEELDSAGLDLLRRHGLDAESRTEQGVRLVVALARQRPLPVRALERVLETGPYAAGGPLLLELLEGATPGVALADLNRLALTLLERGADPFVRDARERSLLHLAVARDLLAFCTALLERGLDPNALDSRRRNALFELIALPESSALALVRPLLAAGADPECAAADGQTPLGAALAHGAGALARWLAWHRGFRHPGRRLLAADLPNAAALGDREAIERMVQLGLPLESRDAQGCTALLRAAGGGHLAAVTWLLDNGASPDSAAQTGATPLSAAVSARREAVVAFLLARGVDPEQRLPGGATPLMLAAALGHVSIARELLARGAGRDSVDEAGNNALHAAAEFAFRCDDFERARSLLSALLDAGVPVDAANSSGQTPLLVLLGARVAAGTPVAQRRLVDLLPLLLQRQVTIDCQDQRGVGCLHAAAMHGLLDSARALLRAGADPTLLDRMGRTASDVAMLLGLVDLAGELKPGAARTLRV